MILSEIRKEKGFTQQKLADSIGVRQTCVAMWESGKAVPSMKNLLKLSAVLSVGVEQIIDSMPKNNAVEVVAECVKREA